MERPIPQLVFAGAELRASRLGLDDLDLPLEFLRLRENRMPRAVLFRFVRDARDLVLRRGARDRDGVANFLISCRLVDETESHAGIDVGLDLDFDDVERHFELRGPGCVTDGETNPESRSTVNS